MWAKLRGAWGYFHARSREKRAGPDALVALLAQIDAAHAQAVATDAGARARGRAELMRLARVCANPTVAEAVADRVRLLARHASRYAFNLGEFDQVREIEWRGQIETALCERRATREGGRDVT